MESVFYAYVYLVSLNIFFWLKFLFSYEKNFILLKIDSLSIKSEFFRFELDFYLTGTFTY